MGSGRVRTKNEYQIALHQYEIRRKETKAKIKALYKTLSVMNERVSIYVQQIRRIEKREEYCKNHIKIVARFFDIKMQPLTREANKRTEQGKDIRNVACKYLLEQGVKGPLIAKYLGLYRYTPVRLRLSFTKSFINNPQNRELWYRFKHYLESSK